LAHRLFCRFSLFDRRFFDGLSALSIGFVQEPIDEARTAFLLDLSLLRRRVAQLRRASWPASQKSRPHLASGLQGSRKAPIFTQLGSHLGTDR
jgi:hypothetical protein